jgi:heterodisulfide reductase subunit B
MSIKFYTECLRKSKYKSYDIAMKYANKAMRERGKKLYVYFCCHCQNFHITHHKTYNGKVRA